MSGDDNPFEGWVTAQQAAQAIGRDHKLVSYWIKKGYIKSHLVGYRTRLVFLDDVIAYAADHPPREGEKPDEIPNDIEGENT